MAVLNLRSAKYTPGSLEMVPMDFVPLLNEVSISYASKKGFYLNFENVRFASI